MNWGDFKAKVDKEIEDAGLNDECEIYYIDIHLPQKDEVNISVSTTQNSLTIYC